MSHKECLICFQYGNIKLHLPVFAQVRWEDGKRGDYSWQPTGNSEIELW